jgi:hypothetical protein
LKTLLNECVDQIQAIKKDNYLLNLSSTETMSIEKTVDFYEIDAVTLQWWLHQLQDEFTDAEYDGILMHAVLPKHVVIRIGLVLINNTVAAELRTQIISR